MISSRREGNINKRTKLKSFLTLDRRSVSPHRPACVRALRGQWAIWLAPRLSLATESTGTVLIPSQMSEIAGHAAEPRRQASARTYAESDEACVCVCVCVCVCMRVCVCVCQFWLLAVLCFTPWLQSLCVRVCACVCVSILVVSSAWFHTLASIFVC